MAADHENGARARDGESRVHPGRLACLLPGTPPPAERSRLMAEALR